MKFSIRDLLLVTVIVALAMGWWLERTRLNGQIETLNGKLDESNGKFEELQRSLEHTKQRAELMRDIRKHAETMMQLSKEAREKYGVP